VKDIFNGNFKITENSLYEIVNKNTVKILSEGVLEAYVEFSKAIASCENSTALAIGKNTTAIATHKKSTAIAYSEYSEAMSFNKGATAINYKSY